MHGRRVSGRLRSEVERQKENGMSQEPGTRRGCWMPDVDESHDEAAGDGRSLRRAGIRYFGTDCAWKRAVTWSASTGHRRQMLHSQRQMVV